MQQACICINKNVCSQIKNIEPGVPQGIVLGPFFFIVYISDLPNKHLVTCADDSTLITNHQDVNYLRQISQEGELRAYDWFSYNKLFNIGKTQH